jgi:hypothetical protein
MNKANLYLITKKQKKKEKKTIAIDKRPVLH